MIEGLTDATDLTSRKSHSPAALPVGVRQCRDRKLQEQAALIYLSTMSASVPLRVFQSQPGCSRARNGLLGQGVEPASWSLRRQLGDERVGCFHVMDCLGIGYRVPIKHANCIGLVE